MKNLPAFLLLLPTMLVGQSLVSSGNEIIYVGSDIQFYSGNGLEFKGSSTNMLSLPQPFTFYVTSPPDGRVLLSNSDVVYQIREVVNGQTAVFSSDVLYESGRTLAQFSLVNLSTTGDFNLQVLQTSHTGYNDIPLEWIVSKSNPNGADVQNLTFTWGSEVEQSTIPYKSLYFFNTITNEWQQLSRGSTTIDEDNNTLTYTGFVGDLNNQRFMIAERNLEDLIVVASGGDVLNSTWTYSNGILESFGSLAKVNSTEVEGYLASGDLQIEAKNITINTAITGSAGIALYGNDIRINADIKTANGGAMYLKGNTTIAAGKYIESNGDFTHDGNLLFKSDANGTAAFGTLGGTFNTVSGTIQVERYIPARRAYRFLSPSVTTTSSIYENWQENGSAASGLGTHITGSGGFTNGFDTTATNNPSMFGFNHVTGQWVVVTNTNINTLTAGTPFRLMVRGDRTTDLTTNTPTPTPTILRSTGSLKTGDYTPILNQAAEGYSFIGNPYQAPIDMDAVLAGATNMNTDVLYYWDPTLNTRGSYVARTLSANINNVTSDFTEILQPGQAVFVKKDNTANVPTMTISETHKRVTDGAAGVFRSTNTSTGIGLLRANLQATIDNQWQTTDAALALFATSYTWDVTQEDATKMNNLDEEVSFIQASTSLAIAKQNDANVTDELPIRLHQLRHTNYRWVFDLTNYNGNTPYLLDTEQNTLSVIEDGTVLPFTAGSDTANRFKIIFQSPLSSPDFTKQIVLYPNPGKGADGFYIAGVSSASVRLYNVVGQEIPVQSQANGQTLQVTPKASLSAGVYNVHITQEGTTAQVKWIVD